MKVPFATFDRLHFDLKNHLDEAYRSVLNSGQFILGDCVSQFEKEFADYCGVKAAVGCGNGLDGLVLSLKAFGIGKGDEVIVPSFTFIATVLSVMQSGAYPVFVDVDSEKFTIDSDKIEQAITPKTKAIMVVHLYGQLADMEKINKLAKKYKLYVIEDAAQAHGAEHNGVKAGKFGDAGSFSFYPGKNLGALGDAGAVVSDDVDFIRKVKAIGNYGSEKKYLHECVGVNSRLDEIQAAFLSVKLKMLDEMNRQRRAIAERYSERIQNNAIKLPQMPADPKSHVWHIYAIRTKDRDRLKQYLESNSVMTVIHYPISMFQQKSLNEVKKNISDFKVADSISETELSLPVYYGMKEEEVDYVCDLLNRYES